MTKPHIRLKTPRQIKLAKALRRHEFMHVGIQRKSAKAEYEIREYLDEKPSIAPYVCFVVVILGLFATLLAADYIHTLTR